MHPKALRVEDLCEDLIKVLIIYGFCQVDIYELRHLQKSLVTIFFEVFRLFHDLLEDLFIPLRRITVLVQ